MPSFILTRSSVIICPHGGFVTHIPIGPHSELIDGQVPMLLNDLYFVAGCPSAFPEPCIRVVWVTASPTRKIDGVPVLTNTSVGICHSASNVPNGPAAILTFQTKETD